MTPKAIRILLDSFDWSNTDRQGLTCGPNSNQEETDLSNFPSQRFATIGDILGLSFSELPEDGSGNGLTPDLSLITGRLTWKMANPF